MLVTCGKHENIYLIAESHRAGWLLWPRHESGCATAPAAFPRSDSFRSGAYQVACMKRLRACVGVTPCAAMFYIINRQLRHHWLDCIWPKHSQSSSHWWVCRREPILARTIKRTEDHWRILSRDARNLRQTREYLSDRRKPPSRVVVVAAA